MWAACPPSTPAGAQPAARRRQGAGETLGSGRHKEQKRLEGWKQNISEIFPVSKMDTPEQTEQGWAARILLINYIAT